MVLLRVSVPVPVLVSAVPEIAPLRVATAEPVTSSVPPPVPKVMPRVKELVAVVCNTALLLMLMAVVPAPRLLGADWLSVPPVMETLPEKVLAPVSVSVAEPALLIEPVPAMILVRVETAPVPNVPSTAWLIVRAVPLSVIVCVRVPVVSTHTDDRLPIDWVVLFNVTAVLLPVA